MSKEEFQILLILLEKLYNTYFGDEDGSSEASDINSTIQMTKAIQENPEDWE